MHTLIGDNENHLKKIHSNCAPCSRQVQASIHPCIHAYIHVHIHIHMYIHVHMHKLIHTHAYTHTHTYFYMFIHVYTCSYMLIHTHTCSYILMHSKESSFTKTIMETRRKEGCGLKMSTSSLKNGNTSSSLNSNSMPIRSECYTIPDWF